MTGPRIHVFVRSRRTPFQYRTERMKARNEWVTTSHPLKLPADGLRLDERMTCCHRLWLSTAGRFLLLIKSPRAKDFRHGVCVEAAT